MSWKVSGALSGCQWTAGRRAAGELAAAFARCASAVPPWRTKGSGTSASAGQSRRCAAGRRSSLGRKVMPSCGRWRLPGRQPRRRCQKRHERSLKTPSGGSHSTCRSVPAGIRSISHRMASSVPSVIAWAMSRRGSFRVVPGVLPPDVLARHGRGAAVRQAFLPLRFRCRRLGAQAGHPTRSRGGLLPGDGMYGGHGNAPWKTGATIRSSRPGRARMALRKGAAPLRSTGMGDRIDVLCRRQRCGP